MTAFIACACHLHASLCLRLRKLERLHEAGATSATAGPPPHNIGLFFVSPAGDGESTFGQVGSMTLREGGASFEGRRGRGGGFEDGGASRLKGGGGFQG